MEPPQAKPKPKPKADSFSQSHCRYCKSPLTEPFLDLGTMALANSFLKPEDAEKDEFVCPLRLCWCPHCGLVQLGEVVPPDLMFRHYLYVSSTTDTFKRHFAQYAQSAKARLLKKEGPFFAVDIGSNDGLLLSYYQNEGMKAVGIEPAQNLSEKANAVGLTTLNDYFGEASVERILKEFGQADVVSGNNVFAHIDDIPSVLRNVSRLLDPQGFFVIEFPYLVTMVEEMLFDMIYHEHLSYIAVKPLRSLLGHFDLEIFAIEKVAAHGGSLRVFIQKKGAGYPVSKEVEEYTRMEKEKGYDKLSAYEEFARRVYEVREKLAGYVKKTKSEGKSISGFGAPAKGNTLINFCGFNSSQIDYLADENPLKQNHLTPGAHIPVVSSRHLFEHPTDAVILFAWNFAEEIVKKLSPLRERGTQFVIPLPQPRVL